MSDPQPQILKAKALVDVDSGNVVSPAYVHVEGERIADVTSSLRTASGAEVAELGDLTLLPGLMDMEVNLLVGGPGATVMDTVQDDPAERLLRAVVNCRRTLRAGFTTVRNLGLCVPTRGFLLDAALARAIDSGWIDGPRIIPAAHAITPTGAPRPDDVPGSRVGDHAGIVEEGVADGVDEVRRAVRYQIKHGAKLIKCCASGGVMSHTASSSDRAAIAR